MSGLGRQIHGQNACDPSYENGWAMCEHIFDRIGCVYNAPSNWSKINDTRANGTHVEMTPSDSGGWV
jgi:hypothetical protein